jgi:hypothetical protein
MEKAQQKREALIEKIKYDAHVYQMKVKNIVINKGLILAGAQQEEKGAANSAAE